MKPLARLVGVVAVAGVLLWGGFHLWAASASDPNAKCGYYTNSAGHSVPSPCGTWNDPPPPRATARCRDGTWSSSEHPYARGTCSYHGGVAGYR